MPFTRQTTCLLVSYRPLAWGRRSSRLPHEGVVRVCYISRLTPRRPGATSLSLSAVVGLRRSEAAPRPRRPRTSYGPLAHVVEAPGPRRVGPQIALRKRESAAPSSGRAPTARGSPRRPRPSTEPSGTASRRRFERCPPAHVYVSVVPGYAFIHRRRVLPVFWGRAAGAPRRTGRVVGVLSHHFDTTGTFCVYGGTTHERTT